MIGLQQNPNSITSLNSKECQTTRRKAVPQHRRMTPVNLYISLVRARLRLQRIISQMQLLTRCIDMTNIYKSLFTTIRPTQPLHKSIIKNFNLSSRMLSSRMQKSFWWCCILWFSCVFCLIQVEICSCLLSVVTISIKKHQTKCEKSNRFY